MANCKEEVWKNIPIEGFENYKVSNLGRVKNKFGKINTPSINQYGYYRVYLFNSMTKKQKQWLVSRLVLMTFSQVDSQDNLEVNHISGDKSDNSIDNLEWVTHKENVNHYLKVLKPTRQK